MPRKFFLLFFIIILSFSPELYAQKDSVDEYEYARMAEVCYKRQSYDSALLMYNSGWNRVKKNNSLRNVIASLLLNGIGDCYAKQLDVMNAHKYYSLALENSRKNTHASEKEIALIGLISVHRTIIEKNLSFNYPPVAEKEEEQVFFKLGTSKKIGDSLEIIIAGGKYDGIKESVSTVAIYSHITNNDSAHHKEVESYGTARIIRLEDNSITVRVKTVPGFSLLPGDFAIIKTYVPLQWRTLSLRKFIISNMFFRDNYNQPVFDYRYFYYFSDSLLEKDVLEIMKTAVKDVADVYVEDTLTYESYRLKSAKGIFAGTNVIKAMLESRPEHFRYFLNFVAEFPGKYVGNNFKFSEVYATWIINSTPFASPDIKRYLLSFQNEKLRRAKIFSISDQIDKEKIPDKLLDDGMRQINIENIAEARQTASLMEEVTTGTFDSLDYGWSNFLFANIEKRMTNTHIADSLLTQSENLFTKYKNKEGLLWINSTKEQWKRTDKIMVGVQNGHLFPFIIAESSGGRYFATGGKDHLIKIWDKTLGREILTISEHSDEITSLNYSNNGRYLVSAAADSSICIYNGYNYALLKKIKTTGIVRTVLFSPDNKNIVSAGEDSLVRFRDMESGTIIKTLAAHKGKVYDICLHPSIDTWMYSCGSDSMVYKWDLETNEWIRWYKSKGKTLTVSLSNDGKFISTLSTDSSFIIWNTETNKKMYWGKVYTYQPGLYTNYATGSFSADSKYYCFPSSKDSFSVFDLTNFYQRTYPTKLGEFHLADFLFSKFDNTAFARFDIGGPLRIYNFDSWDIRNNSALTFKDLKPFSNLTYAVQFTKDDNNIVISHQEVGKIDLRNASYERLYYSGGVIENSYLLLNDETLGVWPTTLEPSLNLYDHKKKEIAKQFKLPEGEKITAIEFTAENNFVFIGTKKGSIGKWDVRTEKKIFYRKLFFGADSSVKIIKYDPYRKRVVLLSEETGIVIINPETGDSITSIRSADFSHVVISAEFIYVTTYTGSLLKYNAATLALLKTTKVNAANEGAYFMALSSDNKNLILQNTFSSLMNIDIRTDSVVWVKEDHKYGGSMIAISHDNKKIATSGFDSKVNLIELTTGNAIVDINLPMSRGPVIIDAEGHYLAAKNALDAVMFSFNNNAYTFDQFDLLLNRPDIILQKMGKADSSLLKTYHLAYKKRLSLLKINEKDISAEVHLPIVRIKDKYAVQMVTTKKEYELNIECSDSRYSLESIQILVNNCPVLGIGGRDLKSLKTLSTVQAVTVPLTNGKNDIKVFCTNSKGISSLKESFSVIANYKPEKPPQNYFIGIGVASYKDKRMNLGYSVKDIRDLAKTFDKYYSNIIFDTLIDANVTKENILAIKKKLLQTNVNDRVILAVTGHGLLSDSLDFYYATWDTDFKKPELKGLKYDDLENLLTDIPARQKLMLIDACHSGALDKEELLALQKDTISSKVITRTGKKSVKGIASRGLIVKNKESKMSANSSFEMMQHLFSDLTASNGAVIISAAGGMEYAFESGKWNNGVFTYCIRKAFEDGEADRFDGNWDFQLSVQELLTYVSRQVSVLTNGKQKPNSRRDNVEYDWIIKY